MLLSRVAENVYWMARHVERSENIARLVNIHTNLLLDLPRGAKIDWESLLLITGSRDLFFTQYKEADERSVTRFMLANEKNPGSLLSTLGAARENLRTTRDIIPAEALETINDLYIHIKEQIHGAVARKERYRILCHVISTSQAITGLLSGTMQHDQAYAFVILARNLERADMTTRILDTRSSSPYTAPEELTPFINIQWLSILKSLTAYQMYRRHANCRVSGPKVLNFILHHPDFPRSFSHCLQQIERQLATLPKCDTPLSALAQIKSTLLNSEIDSNDANSLRTCMDELQVGIAQLHNSIGQTYFLSDDSKRPVANGSSQSQKQDSGSQKQA